MKHSSLPAIDEEVGRLAAVSFVVSVQDAEVVRDVGIVVHKAEDAVAFHVIRSRKEYERHGRGVSEFPIGVVGECWPSHA